ncbi:phosphomethylpyrimidine synthase ThiC [Streptomyces sp. NPDC056362]|uniref:phosphomethylpyrimidine synthase ThiC n=1 Tax=unclassified Streptomyces TaxID=2593676 RepID=UPI0035DB9E2A
MNGVSDVQEVREGLLSEQEARTRIDSGSLVALRASGGQVLVGPGSLVKVNTSIGCNRAADLATEVEKIAALGRLGYQPDLMMDLSTVRLPTPLYRTAGEQLGLPVGTLPHYLCFKPRRGIDVPRLLDEIEQQAASGVAWMTLHLSPTREMYELARATRQTATTARGGGIVVRDMLIHDRAESVLAERFGDIAAILGRHGVALSLGTTFRPASTVDALDAAHIQELERQQMFYREARALGVPTMLEAVGHMRLGQIGAFTRLLRGKLGYPGPVMTLGPIPTDAAVGNDHIANALGAGMLAVEGGTDVVNSVTREEHTGQVPNLDSILEGLRAARIAAHSANISLFPDLDFPAENQMTENRGANYTCVVDGGLFEKSAQNRFAMGCTRCGNECPLLVNFVTDREDKASRT